MVDIKLSQKSGNYKGENETVDINTEDYGSPDSFHKVTYEILYDTPYPSSSWWFWSKRPFYVYIRSVTIGNVIFTYYTNSAEHVLRKVEAFYSKNHPRIPLVIGFIRSRQTQYYKYEYLTKLKNSTGFPEKNYFSDNDLNTKLNEENTRRNKLTFKKDEQSTNYKRDKDNENYKSYVQYKYSVDEDKFSGPYILSQSTLFEGEKGLVYESFFDTENKSFDFIEVYYSDNNIALLVKFSDNSIETGSTSDTYFKRVTREGKQWKQISEKDTDLNPENITATLEKVFYDINQSIVIYINKKIRNGRYSVRLVENIEGNKNSYKRLSLNILVKVCSTLSDRKYECFYNDLSQTTTGDNSGLSNVFGLRLFVGSKIDGDEVEDSTNNVIEVKLYESTGRKRELIYYKTASGQPENNHKIYTYFYSGDKVPLLICYGTKWYKSLSEEPYFDKWAEEPRLKGFIPDHSVSESRILSQLKQINKDLNNIFLNKSSDYGLTIGNKKPKDLSETRVEVNTFISEKYIKITHKTTNKGEIGKVMIENEEIQDCDKSKTISQVIESENSHKNFNQVTIYYHFSDSTHISPVLLGFGRQTSSPDLFYERKNSTETKQWKKIDQRDTTALQNELGLTNKINAIHYKFNKSLKIQLDEQKNQYQPCLVNNGSIDSDPGSAFNDMITVINTCDCLRDPNYVCYKHTIPTSTGSIKEEYIGGLRLFVLDKEILTHKNTEPSEKLPIYYNYKKKDVHVYFYRSETVDKVPLLVSYNGNYYKPSSKGNYFNKWVEVQGITNPNSELKEELDNINLNLNEINISQTDDNSSYGIPKPDDSPKLISTFQTDRIQVKACKSSYYRKISHKTTNEYSIGKVHFNGKLTTGLDSDRAGNEICIYYFYNDVNCLKPLIIEIKSSDSNNWYSRDDPDGIRWTNIEVTNYNEHIKKQLHTINSKLFIPLTIKMEHHDNYKNDADTTIEGAINSSQVKVDRFYKDSSFRPESYRCCEHEVYSYYNDTKRQNGTLEVLISIADNNIALLDNNSKMFPLYYKNNDAVMKYSIIVYFYEKDSIGETDKVPLMFNFRGKFFGPIDKSSYFKKWKQIDISLSAETDSIRKNIKDNLDKINSILNEIDYSQIKDYGIPYCSGSYYYKRDGFSSKRVDVTGYSNSTHTMHVHYPVNKYKINNIKAIGEQDFNEHINKLGPQEIDQVAFIFESADNTYPKLVLLNQKTTYSNPTLGYYYRDNEGRNSIKYQFMDISDGCDLMDSLTTTTNDYGDCREGLEPIKEILRQLTAATMKPISHQRSEVETIKCDQDVDRDVKQCPETEQPTSKDYELVPKAEGGPCGPQGVTGETGDAQQLLLPVQEAIPTHLECSPQESPSSLASASPGLSSKPQPDSRQHEQESVRQHQEDSQEVSTERVLRENTSDSRTEGNDGHTVRESGEESKGIFSESSEITPPTTQQELSENIVGLSDSSVTSSSQSFQENGLHLDAENSIQHSREENTVISRTRTREEERPVTEDGVDDAVGGFRSDGLSSNFSSSNPSSSTGAQGDEDSDNNPNDFGGKFMKFIDENKEAVYGGGGTVVTAGSSAYPLYKGISKLITK